MVYVKLKPGANLPSTALNTHYGRHLKNPGRFVALNGLLDSN